MKRVDEAPYLGPDPLRARRAAAANRLREVEEVRPLRLI
jgi:hypothetical protein